MKTAQVLSLLLFCWCMLVMFYLYKEQPQCTSCKTTIQSLGKNIDRIAKLEIVSRCIDSRLLHIGGLEKQVNQWKMSEYKICKELCSLFDTILRVESRTGHLNVTKTFNEKLLKWFGGNRDLVSQAKTQTVIFVANKWTYDTTVFNPIRDKRPIVKANVTDIQYVQQIVEKTAKSCDFCNYQKATSPDFYGRIETPHCYTASNAFKLDAWHALIIFREHHPLRWTEDALMDVFSTAMKWFGNINKHNPDFIYPILFWDLLPHASASQVHPHVHVVISNTMYWGNQEEWRQVGKQYKVKLDGRDYYADLTAIHDILGLNVRHGSANAFASLTPKKDHEIVIMSHTANRDFFQMVYYVTRGFLDDLEQLCFSMSIEFPSLKAEADGFHMPVILRIVTRGTVSDVRSDVSSMELFAASNVNIDPFKTVKIIQQSVSKRSSKI